MFSLLMGLWIIQAQIGPADVPVIMNKVIDALLPSEGNLRGPQGVFSIGDRQLFVDTERSAEEFRKINPRLPATVGQLTRSHQPRSYSMAIGCTQSRESNRVCRVADDAIYVSVISVEKVQNRDEYRLMVQVLWNAQARVTGYTREVFVRKDNSQWQIRAGGAQVY